MSRLMFLLACSYVCATAAVRFGTANQVLDLRQYEWQYTPEGTLASPEQAMASNTWKPVRVGLRWDELGYPELKKGNVWLRLAFTAEPNLSGRKVGFFATLIDDEADIFLNGHLITTVKYNLGALVRGPAIADLTPQLHAGAENVLLLHIRDTYVRSPGVIGNVCLFQSLHYQRTPLGGISTRADGPLSVVLHVGDALLSRGETTGFTAGELASLSVPPYILREDELILLVPQKEVTPSPAYRVDMNAVNPIRAAQPLSVRSAVLPASLPCYSLLDLPLELAASYDNPFDPRQINVQALIETPSGRIDKVPAFFRQDFRRVAPSDEEEILLPVKGPAWRVYYRPHEVGRHKVEIFAQDRTGTRKYDAGSFSSDASNLPGFLHVSKRDPSFFEYDNGQSFFALGPSGWYRGRDYIFGGDTRWVSSQKLEQYYERKAANRSNYEYLGTFHFGQLLLSGGIIDQHIAWKLEHSLRTMERLGIRWLVFHDDVLRMSRYGFDVLPYAAASGGPAKEINDLYFSETVMDLQKNQLRYLVGRMSDSPSIWIWNIGDEWGGQPGNQFSAPMVSAWINTLHRYVKEIDVYSHPHAIGEGMQSILAGGDVYLLGDWYLREVSGAKTTWQEGNRRDLIEFVPRQTTQIGERPFPVVNVEGGIYGWNSTLYQSGKPWGYPEAITFHQHLWLGLFIKNAASGTDWMVNVLDHDNQLFHAKALAQFLDGESLTAKPFEQSDAATSDSKLTAFALRNSDKTLAWVVNRTWNWMDQTQGRTAQPLSGQSIKLPVVRDGRYDVELWNTFTGAVQARLTLESSGNLLAVPLPEITNDLALKCIRHE
ncbi:MAG: hypothetical protein ABSC05_18355 [Candidatus Solibacter sp.]|jgi:hypothetical protein